MAIRKHSKTTRKKMSDSHPKRPVVAIHCETHETTVYASTRAAANEHMASSNITAACKGRLRHCYGFYWRYADEFESVEKVLQEAAQRPGGRERAVVSIDPVNRVSKLYPSIKAAGDDGFDYNAVVAALLGRSRRGGGFYWRYADDFKTAETVLSEEAAYDAEKRRAS